jgi:dTDP-4-dehydrorhamnose reductase
LINTEAKTILVTGANGQLGSELRQLRHSYPGYHFLFTGSKELDISDHISVHHFFRQNPVDYCINCAAYTAVDKAETERSTAEKINSDGPAYLAEACRKFNAKLFHISTDYVFNGKGSSPYKPGDATDPVNFYGGTKLAGEQKALLQNKETIIIRTAWVYSSFGHNFVKTMIRLMGEKESIGVVNDQHGSPTYAADLAVAIMHIIATGHFVPGIYHFTDSGSTTWFGFAKEIAALLETKCIVNPVTTDQYPTAAARPAYSVMDTSSIINTFDVSAPQWQHSLEKCLALLK